MSDDMTLGRYIDAARKDAALSMRQLAEAADVHLTILARLQRDEMLSPKPEHLIGLANALELRASDLFLLAGVPIPQDLPTVEALLRAEYDLPEEAVVEAKQQIEAIVARYQAQSTNRKEEKSNGKNKCHS